MHEMKMAQLLEKQSCLFLCLNSHLMSLGNCAFSKQIGCFKIVGVFWKSGNINDVSGLLNKSFYSFFDFKLSIYLVNKRAPMTWLKVRKTVHGYLNFSNCFLSSSMFSMFQLDSLNFYLSELRIAIPRHDSSVISLQFLNSN